MFSVPRVQNRKQLVEPPSGTVSDIPPDRDAMPRRILPDGPAGWAKLVLAIATLVTAVCGGFVMVVGSLTEAVKVVFGG